MRTNSANIVRGQVTVSFGANIAAHSRADVTAAFNGAAVGDKPICTPAIVNASASIIPVPSPAVTTANVITVSHANLGTATVAAGTAVVHNVSLIKNTGESNVP
jgi:hypothetical protein